MFHLVENDSVFSANDFDKIGALVFHFFSGSTQTFAPLCQSDLVVIVRIAAIEKVSNARFHRQQWRSQRKKLVARYMSKIRDN